MKERLLPARLLLAATALLAWALAGCGGSSNGLPPLQPSYDSFTREAQVSAGRGALQGAIADKNGIPVPEATVTVNDARRSRATSFSVTTGANGEYAIGNMEPGTYTLRVACPGVGETTGEDITVAAGQVTYAPSISLSGEVVTTGRIVGHVTVEAGLPLEGAIVQAVHEMHTGEALSGVGGEYTIGSLPPATYAVTAFKDGYAPRTAQVTVVVGQDVTADLTLGPLGSRAYIGSGQCQSCHGALYNDYLKSGHPYKLSRVASAQPPSFPFSAVPEVPTGYSWADITYLIGGYGWKARFIDSRGYIVTGSAVQYNRANGSWSGYEASVAPGTKPYTCGGCHTTGWTATGAAGPHQDGLPGMHGTFSEPGITCEACHGPGSNHVATRSRADIEVNRSAAACGNCHFRDSQHRISAKATNGKGFIEHHEQYDELISARHQALQCVDCHNPHRSTVFGQGGVSASCASCHPQQASKIAHMPFTGGPSCVDCHMPRATKSALAKNIHEADIRSHTFKINTEPVDQSAMWYTQGSGTFARGFVTLDFACYGCHNDPNGVGGGRSVKTLQELSLKAMSAHK